MRILLPLLILLLAGCGGSSSNDSVDSGGNSGTDTDTIIPIADAGHSMQLQRGATAVLNGSDSFDPNGAALTYNWRIVTAPSGSTSELSDTTSPFPSLFLDEVGSYEIALIVNDGTNDSEPSTVIISDTDSMPVANAGFDRRVSGNQAVALDGSLSSDSDGDQLSYQWSITSSPSNSTATLTGANSPFAVLTPDASGDYQVQLIVSDGTLESAPDTVLISDTNVPPVANAGPSQTYEVGNSVRFDGSASSDADGNALSYQWRLVSAPAGSQAQLQDADSVLATITPDVEGDYVVSLTVNDGEYDSRPSSTILHRANQAPVANAGTHLSAQLGQVLHLDGSASTDGDGDPIEPRWSIVSKPDTSQAQLSDTDTFHPQITPDVSGDYVVQLIVYDGQYLSAASTVTISTSNLPPTANAGQAQIASSGQLVHLDASRSYDPEGSVLTYEWSVIASPQGSAAALSSTDVAVPSFTPDLPGDYIFQLIVSDGELKSSPITVVVTDNDLPPKAVAGPDQSASAGSLVTLNGSLSSDPELQPLTYEWALLSRPLGSNTAINDANRPVATLTPDVFGDYVAQLTVVDAAGQRDSDVVVIRDESRNTLPVANAGPDIQVELGTQLVLDGSGSIDADGDPLTYGWAILSRPAGSSAQLNDVTTRNPNFTPDVEGDFVVQLVVSDGKSTSLPDVVVIHDQARNLAPVSFIGNTPTGVVGEVYSLDGSQSSDPNGDSLTYTWNLIPPQGSVATLSGNTGATPAFTPDRAGDYLITLTVSDGPLSSLVDSRIIKAIATLLPVADAGHSMRLQKGATAVLNGSGSFDPDGAALTYSWSIVSAPPSSTSELSDTTSPFPSLFLDEVGSYEIALIVNNGTTDSIPSTVIISDTDSMPVANAGPDVRISGNQPIMLDGSRSSDSDGDQLTYEWTIIGSPSNSNATLTNANSPFAVLSPDVSGDYQVQLIVSDGILQSVPDTVLISDSNVPPVANAGPSQTYEIGNSVRFDGSASSDADGNALNYQWRIVSAPANSQAQLQDANSVLATITPDVAGDYVVSLTVNDGEFSSLPSSTVLHRANQAPVARAGNNLNAQIGQVLHLDGSASTDGDGDTIEPRWSIISKPKASLAQLSDIYSFYPQITPDVSGDYVIQLIVYDGQYLSGASSVTISTSNLAPTANAGQSQVASSGQLIHLDGSRSFDPEGSALSYEWSVIAIPQGSTAAITNPDAVLPSFTPDIPGDYIFQLIVSDGVLKSSPATVVITDKDLPPKAVAGADQSVSTGSLATLDGSSSSDPELQPLTYEWALLSSPSGSSTVINNPNSPVATLNIDRSGDYVAQLTVMDAVGQRSSDVVVIRDAAKNTLPVADAGRDLQVDLGARFVLDGSGSNDADGDTLTYSWAILSRPVGSSAQLNNASTRNPDLTPDVEGDFVIQLVVSDGKSTSLPDVVVIHDEERNLAPFAYIGIAPEGVVGTTYTVDGSQSSDPNGDAISYSWDIIPPQGSTATLTDNTSAMPSFLPDIAGDYVVVLAVSDGALQSAPFPRVITINSPVKGAAISLPAGHNLMMLSATGGESGTGAVFSISESDLSQSTEIFSFHGVPGFGSTDTSQSLVVHPTDGHMYALLGQTGLYGRGALIKYNPANHEVELLTNVPSLSPSGNVINEARGKLLFHPDGKTAYAIANKGGLNSAGVVLQFNLDSSSENYLTTKVIAEFGDTGTDYTGSFVAPLTNLMWNGSNRLLALFGTSFTPIRRPGFELTASDPNDLSQPWNISGFGEGIIAKGRHIAVDDDAVIHFSGTSSPTLSASNRSGGIGEIQSDCKNPVGAFFWRDPSVFALCEGSGSDVPPTLFETTMSLGSVSLRHSFGNWKNISIAGLTPSKVVSNMYITVNDSLAILFSDPNSIASGLTIEDPFLSEISKPNFSDVAIIRGGGDRGLLFIGDPAILNDSADSVNDRYVSVLSFNGGDTQRGAILTYDRADSSVSMTSLGFNTGGFPFGKISKNANGDYFLAVSDGELGRDSGKVFRYDSALGTLDEIPFPRVIRPGLNHVESNTGALYGLGIDLSADQYELYSIDSGALSYQKVLNIGNTSDEIPQYELTIDSNNLWFFTEDALNCMEISSNNVSSVQLSPSGDVDPVRAVTFASQGADGYFATLSNSGAGASLQRLVNDCATPSIVPVVTGLNDVPSTALLAASDGMFYYSTENGKLMQFDGVNQPVSVASFTNTSVVGFLTEDALGDIVGVLSNGNAAQDKLFSYTISSGSSSTQDVPEDRAIDTFYPGVTEID